MQPLSKQPAEILESVCLGSVQLKVIGRYCYARNHECGTPQNYPNLWRRIGLTPGSEGMKGAIAKAEEIAKERNGWLPLQFNNPANPEVHERTTGAEIIAAFGKKGLDAFVGEMAQVVQFLAFLTLSKKSIQIYSLRSGKSDELPLSCPVKKPGPHKIQGISAGFIPETLDTQAYDGIVRVTSDQALDLGRRVGGQEGFLVGISSAAAIYAALEVAQKLGTGKKS